MPADDPLKYFRIEARELCEKLEGDLLSIEQSGVAEATTVAALLRYAHTLKGAARVVRRPEIADHAHALEDLLQPLRAGGSNVSSETMGALLSRLDELRAGVRALDTRPDEGRVPTPAVERRLAVPPESPKAAAHDLDDLVDHLGDAAAELEALSRLHEPLERAHQLRELLERQLSAPRRGDAQGLAQTVERAKITTGELAQQLSQLERGLREGIERVGRELGGARLLADRMRLVPVSTIFVALARAASDAARELGRRVTFQATGGDVRLDAGVLEVAHAALLQTVRNAVVHGIEDEAARRRSGKPPAGNVEVAVTREGRDVVFLCRDDGRGLDGAAARRALARSGAETRDLSDGELLARLPSAGISTAAGISELAGRGIGLDVLRQAAETLGGTVRLDSRAGRGFEVELRVPYTLASVEGLAIACDDRVVMLPLESVSRTVRVRRDELARTAQGQGLSHEGKVLPFAPLSRVLGVHATSDRQTWSALVVKSAGGAVAVGADRLLGTRSAVLRPVPAVARATRVVAGVALDSVGAPELVLDAEGIAAEVRALTGTGSTEGAKRGAPILIIDDSLTTRILEQSILEAAGYEVELATSAEEGLEKARQGRYALFLVDVEMPGMDGFSFVERTRSDASLAKVPAVLVSSRSAPEDFKRGEAAGARGYIVKDRFDQRELLELIERLVGE